MHRWQDEQSIDLSHIITLKEPLNSIISLFESFHIPNHDKDKRDGMPVFHVENTLAILQNLLGKYDGTMDALNQVFL